jgi:hypothetical protein
MAYLGEMNEDIEKQKVIEELKEGDEPKTLWDMFQEYLNQKEKVEAKKMVDFI